MTDFRTLAQLSSDALLVVNDAGDITYANDAAHDLLAPPATTLAGQPAAALWHPNPLAVPGDWDSQGRLAPVRVTGASGAATGRALEVSGQRAATPSGHALYLKAGLAQPATQAATDGLAARVRTALALSTDAAMVVDARTLAFLDANAAACELMGMTHEQVLARGPTRLRRRDGTGTEDFHALYAQLIARSPQALTHEYDFIAGDGRVIPVATTRQALNIDGRWLIFITWRDISERVAVQARLEQFKAAFDQTADAVTMVDVRTRRYVYSNPAHLKLLGLSQDELDALGPEGVARRFGGLHDLQAFYDSVIAQYPRPIQRETTHLAADGSTRYIRVRHHALRSGDDWLVISAKIDVTARKQERRRLERITAAFDASGDAIYIIDPSDFSYVDVNEAAARLHGMSRDELRALGVRGAFPDRFDDAGLRARYDDLIARHPRAVTEERQIPRADGRLVWAESIRRAVQVDGQWLVISVMREITERKAAHSRIERLAAVVNMSPDAVMLVDRATMQVIDVNAAACAMHGCTRDELMALPVHLTLKDTTRETLEARYDAVIARTPEVVHEEVVERRPDGGTFSAEVRRQALRSDGAWIMVVTVRDLSESKAAQARLELMHEAINAAPDAIVVIDPRTLEYLDVNEATAQMYGLTREQLLARGARKGLGGTSTDVEMRQFYARIVAQAPAASVEERAARLNGRDVTLEFTRRAVNVNGRWLIVSVNRDITERKAAQARVERFAAIVNLSADAVFVVDRESMLILDVNESTCRMYGYARDDLVGRPVQSITFSYKDTPGRMEAEYDQVIAQSPRATIDEKTARLSSGGTIQAEVQRMALQSEGRWLIVTMVRDISERKAAQARQELLTAAIEAAPDGIAVVDPQTLRYLHVNDAVCRTHAASREQLMALGVDGVFSGQLAPDAIRALYQSVIDRYPSATSEERAIVALDGTTAYYEAVRRAVRVDGRWLIISMNRDITERKNAQARIERFAAVLNLSADAVMLVDRASMRIIDVNEAACRMHGYSREDLLALPPHLSREGTTLEQLTADYDEAIRQSPAVVHAELNGRRADGSSFVAEVQRQALRQTADGGWIIAITVRDVSERKAAEARMHRLRAAIDFAPDAIYLIDPVALEYVDMNQAAGRAYGMTRDEVAAMGMQRFLARLGRMPGPQTLQDMRQRYAALIADYPRVEVQERLVRLPGRAPLYTETLRQAVQIDGQWLILSMLRDVTERKLEQQRMERFAAVLNLSADAVLMVDRASLRIIDVNEAACRMYGYTRDQMLALAPHEGRDDTTREQLIADYDEAIRRWPDVVHAEITARRADGGTFIAEVQRQALNSQADGGWIIAITARDVTQRKAAEAGLKRLKAVVDVAPDGMYIIDPRSQEYVALNHAAGQLYGLTRDEVMRMGMAGFMRWLGSFDDNITLESVRERHAWLIDNYPQVHVSERLVRLPGRADIVTETLRQAVQVDGEWLILVVVRDITDRKRAEDEIRKRVAELELLREAYNAAVDSILIADPETLAYHDMNDAAVQLLGVSREALLAGGVEASYYSTANEPFDAVRLRKGYRYVISRAPEAVIDVRAIKPLGLGGREAVIEFSRRGVNVQGRWVVVTLMRDITAQRRAEEEIRQRVAELTRSNQELEQFAYVTSHDLSEPLRMVASYTQLLSKRYADKFDDDGREFIKYAVDGAQRMKQLIDDLLMYSRAGRSRAPMRMMRLDRALDDALANLAHAIERNGATIERGPMPELVCEKAGLTQVFQNLVGNAIKFRGEAAPVVRIAAVEDEQFWTVSVADNGIGIAPEYFQRIFIIFQRLHSRSKYEGTGIGLSICKKIVERHGGQITVASEPGHGTTFSFTLSKSLPESEPT